VIVDEEFTPPARDAGRSSLRSTFGVLTSSAALLPLFELADDSPAQVAAYIGLGEVLVALEAAGSDVLGHLQLVGDGEALELKSMAVIAARRGEGIGRALVEAAIAGCRARGA